MRASGGSPRAGWPTVAAGLLCWAAVATTASPAAAHVTAGHTAGHTAGLLADGRLRLPPANRSCRPDAPAGPAVPGPYRMIDAERAWALGWGAPVLVAVVDTGVDSRHRQLAGAVLPGADLLYPGGGPGDWDCDGHGTGMASIIAARGAAGLGLRGVAPEARILPVAVSEQGADQGRIAAGQDGAVAQAIGYAVQQGAKVVNVSLVTYEDTPELRAAVAAAVAADVVVVAAGGDGFNAPDVLNRTPYPAAYEGVLGVGAIDQTGQRLPGSQVGRHVDLVAPGDQVPAAGVGGGYGTYSGTGIATAFVSATVALVRSHHPSLPAAKVVERMLAAADPSLGGRPGLSTASSSYGHGVVNAYRSIVEHPGAGSPARSAPLRDPMPDPATVARAAWWERAQDRSLGLTLGGIALTAGLAVVIAVMPRGRRRRWRPGSAPPPREPAEVADPTVRLFDDLNPT